MFQIEFKTFLLRDSAGRRERHAIGLDFPILAELCLHNHFSGIYIVIVELPMLAISTALPGHKNLSLF